MYETLVQALQFLDERCDGAHEDDGAGFNGRDTKFGKSLASQTRAGRRLTPAQEAAAIKMLQTYRNQLKGCGVDLPTVTQYMGVKVGEPTPATYFPPAQRVTQVTVGEKDGQFEIRFRYDPKLVDIIKALPRRKFDRDSKTWLVPSDMQGELAHALKGYDVTWNEDALEIVRQTARVLHASMQAEAELEVPNLTGELMPFQRAGVAFIDTAQGRAIIGDEMGLGKTIQAIGYLALHPELRPAVIVVPASLKPNWNREIAKWLTTKEYVHVLNGTKTTTVPGSTIFIINYDILAAWQKWLSALNPAVMICDEAHYLKSPKSQRTKAAMALAQASEKVILMSGTPILNRPAELYPLLKMVRPENWPDFMSYARRYCGARQRTFGKKKVWDFSGATNLPELNAKLKTVMIRRLKREVLTELPDKRRVVVPIEIDLDEYNDFMETTLDELEAAGNQAAQMVIIERAKQYVVDKKLDSIYEWIDDFLESGEKLILFCTHRIVAQFIMERYSERAVKITGESSQEERDYAVQAFQHQERTQIFVGNIQAAGVGLTLTAASNVAFLELAWRPGDHTQSEDRAHRIGQKNAVTAWYLLAEGTIDETIFNLLEKKRITTETVTDGQASEQGFSTENIVGDLVSILRQQRKEKV